MSYRQKSESDRTTWIGCDGTTAVPYLGFVFECQPGGPDFQVYRAFLNQLVEAGELTPFCMVPQFMSNTEKLLAGCGAATKNLLRDGCQHVFVCWDLYPEWEPKPKVPCRKVDRDRVLAQLDQHEVSHTRCTTLCICQELEAWLLADGAALVALAKRDAQPKVKHENKPESLTDPKMLLAKRWETLKCGKYNDWYHAVQLAEKADLKRVIKAPSFARLVCKAKVQVSGSTNRLVAC